MKMTKKVLSILLSLMLVLGAVSIGGMSASADGSVYEISSYADLKEFASRVNSGETGLNAKLMNDIVATGYNDWTPIGYYESDIDNCPFTGTFDGDGYVVTGLSTPADYNSNYAGLFGYVGSKTEGGVTTKGTVKNVGLEGGSITGQNYVGGVVGYNNGGSITNCYNTGDVSGNDYVGGVVGYNNGGSITNCYNTGAVSGVDYVGGVVGYNNGGSITNCYNTGAVTATATVDYAGVDAGGVAGYNAGTVTNCYNKGAVSGADCVGGVVGLSNGTVTNCYNTGNVSSSDDAGGVVGFIRIERTVTNCYNTGNITATDDYADVGGIAGFISNDSTVTNCYSTGNITATGDSADVGGVAGFVTTEGKTINCYYDKTICGEIGAYDGADIDSAKGLTTDQMTGTNALDNMTFAYEAGEESPWLTKADGADENGGYYWFYPHLKGFAYDRTSAAEDWPAKVEITVALSDGNSCTYDGDKHGVYVTIGDTSIPEGTIVTYSKYGSTWGTESEITPTDPGNYRMTIRNSADEVVETKYFTILEQATDYTVSYYIKTGEDWSMNSVDPIDAGDYKAVVTFTDTGHDQIEKEFTITPKSILSESVNVILSQDTAEYTGGEITPEITVKDGEKVLTKDTDYTVIYSNNVNASENAKVTVTGKGNYKDSADKMFTINPASVTLTANSRNTDVYDGTEKTASGFTSSVEGLTFDGVNASGSGTNAGAYDVAFNGVALNETKDSTGNYVVTATENGTLTINPADVTVSVKGNSATEDYDGSEKSATGYTATASNNLYDVENDIEFSGTAEAKRTEPGNESMGLDASQFSNINANFNATFTVEEDGKLTVNPVIKFVNEDGTELQSSAVSYGETPEYKGETPAKAASDGNTYEFAGWSPEITEATANATYTATYKSNAIGLALGEIEDTTGYKEDQTFTVDTSSLPEGAEIHWFVNGEDVGTGESYTVEDPTEDYNIYAAVVDADGNTLDETQVQAVKVRNGFMDKLKWFFSDFWNNIFKAVIDAIIKAC